MIYIYIYYVDHNMYVYVVIQSYHPPIRQAPPLGSEAGSRGFSARVRAGNTWLKYPVT